MGMALKYEGCPVSVWDDWSRTDSRYHSGECEKKWESFSGSAEPVTGATIFQMARQNGYKPEAGRELAWDDTLSYDGEMPSDEPQESVSQLITYLEALFEADENVGYVTESWKKEDRYLPNKGHCDRTAGQLIEALSKCNGDIGAVLGDYNKEAGAWRIDGTLREFAKFEPLNLWFDYPVHGVDNTGILKDVADEDTLPSFKKASIKRKQNNENRNEKNKVKFENAINFCNGGEAPTVKQVMEYLDDMPEKTLRGWIKKFGYAVDKNTHLIVKCEKNI